MQHVYIYVYSIMTMVPNFTTVFISVVFIFKPFFKCEGLLIKLWIKLHVNGIILIFVKLIYFIECFIKNPQSFSMQSSPLHTSYLFSILLNVPVGDIEYPRICSSILVVDNFSELLLHPSTFFIKDWRSA